MGHKQLFYKVMIRVKFSILLSFAPNSPKIAIEVKKRLAFKKII